MDKDLLKAKAERSASAESPPAYGESSSRRGSLGQRILESFQRDPNAHVTAFASFSESKGYDIENAAEKAATSPLQRHLRGRHLQMIAIGGSIGMFTLLTIWLHCYK
jgi:amino acid transporter